MPHQRFIRECYSLAVSAVRKGNHPFGALLVKAGKVIITAENSVNTDHDCTLHAELALISQASRKFPPNILQQSVLYTSTEPCPMCTGAIYWAGIPTIVFGCSAAALRALTNEGFELSCREVLAKGSREITVIGPVLEAEGMETHRSFW